VNWAVTESSCCHGWIKSIQRQPGRQKESQSSYRNEGLAKGPLVYSLLRLGVCQANGAWQCVCGVCVCVCVCVCVVVVACQHFTFLISSEGFGSKESLWGLRGEGRK
jgi:hypothetical protein